MDSSRRPTDFLATNPLSFFIRPIMSGWHHTVAYDEIRDVVESHFYDDEYSDHGDDHYGGKCSGGDNV